MTRFIDKKALLQIKQNADWQATFEALGLVKDPKRSKPHDWWALSPLTIEKTASFHMNHNGWFCHSTNQGGGIVELVQKVMEYRGTKMNCFEAGAWLVESGASWLDDSRPPQPKKAPAPKPEPAAVVENPKRERKVYDLIPYLSQQGTHPQFVERGISKATCSYLGCGYLAKGSAQMQGRIVFQIRGVEKNQDGSFKPVILDHLGRAIETEQEEKDGKYTHYPHFDKTSHLYNLDKVLLDPRARAQAKETGRVLIVEGPFDAAKIIESGTFNVVASFGWALAEKQIPDLRLIADELQINRFFAFYDRDKVGIPGIQRAIEMVNGAGLIGEGFDWNIRLNSLVGIPEEITDPCKFSVKQLQWLKKQQFLGK